jgi:dethiobiotin synthetase
MSTRFFITGTGTGVGKTLVSAILTEALQADYWKPVQAGYENGTDSEWVSEMISNKISIVHPEAYKLKLAASPHLAARRENISIDLQKIAALLPGEKDLIVEGPGGLMVPLNDNEFVVDLIRILQIKVILVSKNELGSINHSLLTAALCREQGIDVVGWIFSGEYLHYEEEIVKWTGLPRIASIPHSGNIDKSFVAAQAALVRREFNTFS